jgi:hypothetical protein
MITINPDGSVDGEVDGRLDLGFPSPGEIPDMILPGGVSMSDPVAQACMIVPLR